MAVVDVAAEDEPRVLVHTDLVVEPLVGHVLVNPLASVSLPEPERRVEIKLFTL